MPTTPTTLTPAMPVSPRYVTTMVNDITNALMDAAIPIQCIGTAEEHALQRVELALGLLQMLHSRLAASVELNRISRRG